MTTQRGTLTRSYSRFIMSLVRNRTKLLVLSALILILGLALLRHFRIETDLSSFYPTDDPMFLVTHRLYGDTPVPKLLTVIFRAKNPQVLQDALPDIVDGLQGSPYLERVIATKEQWFGERIDWAMQSPLYFVPDETL